MQETLELALRGRETAGSELISDPNRLGRVQTAVVDFNWGVPHPDRFWSGAVALERRRCIGTELFARLPGWEVNSSDSPKWRAFSVWFLRHAVFGCDRTPLARRMCPLAGAAFGQFWNASKQVGLLVHYGCAVILWLVQGETSRERKHRKPPTWTHTLTAFGTCSLPRFAPFGAFLGEHLCDTI